MEKMEEAGQVSPIASVNDEEAVMESLHTVETNNVRPACFNSTITEILFVLTATMAIAMNSFSAGAVVVISSFVGRDLGMTTAEITWISSAMSLAGGAFLLFFGRMADLFGRKSLFVGSLFLFAVFALAAGFAKTPLALDVLAGVMGLMSASGVPPAVGLLGIVYEKPSKRKNAAFACFSAGNPLGFVFGTIFSGIATSLFSWRASFWLLAIIYLCFSIIAFFTVPKDFTDKEPLNMETFKRFDPVGNLCTIAGVGMFSAALSLGSTAPQGWRTGYVLALLIVGVLLMAGFVVWENIYKYPLVPMGIWKDRDFSLVLAILLLGFMAFPVASFFIALFFQVVWRFSALEVAIHLLPMAIMGIIVNIIAGLILHRVSNKLLMGIGATAYTISFTLLAMNRQQDSYWKFCFPAFLFGVIGADLEFNVANMYVMSSLPKAQQSIAGGIFQTVTKLCMTLGLGIATALYTTMEKDPSLESYWDPATQPFTATFWLAAASAGTSVCLVPFLTIGTQGGKEKKLESVSDSSDGAQTPHERTGEKLQAEATVMQALPAPASEDL